MEKEVNIHLFLNDLPDNFTIDGDIAIDTETLGLNVSRDRLCVLQFSNGDGHAYLVKFNGNDYSAKNLKKLLCDNSKIKIFHFGRFDLAIIQKNLGISLKNIFCTKIASKIARTYTDQHGLKDLCREFLGINLSKQQQTSYWGALNLTHEQKEYAARDVIYLHQLRAFLIQMLQSQDRLVLIEPLMQALPTRAMLDVRGYENLDIFSH